MVNYLVLCITFSCPDVSNETGQVVTFILVVNSAVNPLVYAFLKRDIKRKIRENDHRDIS